MCGVVRDAVENASRENVFAPRVRTSTYKRLHLLRYSIHARSTNPSFVLNFSLAPLLSHPCSPGCYSHRPVLAQQCQYFVVRRITRVLPTHSHSFSLSLFLSLCVLHYSRGNCSEFQSLVETRGRYSRSESGNARECRLNLRGRFVRRRRRGIAEAAVKMSGRSAISLGNPRRICIRRAQTCRRNFIIQQISRWRC